MDYQEHPTERDITLTILIPGGQETTATVHGSKPVMDVLVTLCAQHHLAPSDHVIKLLSTNQNQISFKANSMIGSLEFEKVVLQAKGSDANKKKPHIPVATVRLLINYKKSHKAVVRVNPLVPLAELMPTVCEKCEIDPDTTVLLRTDQSEEPLDLTKTLNDYSIRELYAKEIQVVPTNAPVDPLSAHKGADDKQKTLVKENKHSEKGNKGFFGLFKKSKKTSGQAETDSSPTSPRLNSPHSEGVNGVNGHALPMIPADLSKKRRAPQPPMTLSQSVASGLHTRDFSDLSENDPAGKEGPLSRISSTESSLKRTKRRAPPPPADGSTHPESDNKEKEAQWSHMSSEKYKARIINHCPQIAQVMNELSKSLRTRQQRTMSSSSYFYSSVSKNPSKDPSLFSFSEPHTPEAELKGLPVCQLLRQSSERESLTTFTVIPQRRQQTEPFTSQRVDTDRSKPHMLPGDIYAVIQRKVFTSGSSSDESELLYLEKENQALSENMKVNDEDQYISPKNTLAVCKPLRKSYDREVFTTFKVVPQRRQQSFGEPVTSQITEPHVCPGDPESPDGPTPEPGDTAPTEVFTNGANSFHDRVHSSRVLHLEKENQAWMDVKSESEDDYINQKNTDFTTFTVVPQRRQCKNLEMSDEEDQRITPKNLELNNVDHFGSKMEDQEVRNIWDGASKPANGLVNREEMEDDVLEEDGNEKNWMEVYKERRRTFLGGDCDDIKKINVWDRIQREFTNTQEENTQENNFLSPPPPVCRDENRGENKNEVLTCNEVNLNFTLSINSKPKCVSFSDDTKANAHSTLNNAHTIASGAQSICRFTPELQSTSFLSHSHSSFDPCPPAQMSLFALAVFQKAKRSKPGSDPNCFSRRQLPVNIHSN